MGKLLRIGFLCSHRGSNMNSVVQACRSGELHAYPAVVIANNSSSGALERAHELDIPCYHFSRTTCPDPEALDELILETLVKHECDLVLLAGYMRKLGPRTLAGFPNRVLNIHPALLPKFGGEGMFGRRVHEAVIASRETSTGITIHCVDQDYDTGPVLAQKEVPVHEADTPESLAARLLPMEHAFLVETLQRVAVGELTLPSKTVPSKRVPSTMGPPKRWASPDHAPELLVSARSAAEALVALLGGASFIDIKEPALGSLGRAPRHVQTEIVQVVRSELAGEAEGRRRVILTAALGELMESEPPASYSPVEDVALYKLGLSQCQGDRQWTERLDAWRERFTNRDADLAAVAYADHSAANAPPPPDVLAYAIDRRLPFLLIDTFEKTGKSLTDFLGTRDLLRLINKAHDQGVAVALAGSLRREDMDPLARLGADVLAVRSAACKDGKREQPLCVERIEELTRILNGKRTLSSRVRKFFQG